MKAACRWSAMHRGLISQNVLPFVGLLVVPDNATRRQSQTVPLWLGNCRMIPLTEAICIIHCDCGYCLGYPAAILCRIACHFGRVWNGPPLVRRLHRLDVERLTLGVRAGRSMNIQEVGDGVTPASPWLRQPHRAAKRSRGLHGQTIGHGSPSLQRGETPQLVCEDLAQR
jgi:hypothetical protein